MSPVRAPGLKEVTRSISWLGVIKRDRVCEMEGMRTDICGDGQMGVNFLQRWGICPHTAVYYTVVMARSGISVCLLSKDVY